MVKTRQIHNFLHRNPAAKETFDSQLGVYLLIPLQLGPDVVQLLPGGALYLLQLISKLLLHFQP